MKNAKTKGIYGLGIVFDIDVLGGSAYGERARAIMSGKLDMTQLSGCIVLAGDTEATLQLKARDYCIAFIGVFEPKTVKRALGRYVKRFLRGRELEAEPLCNIGSINKVGEFIEANFEGEEEVTFERTV